MVDYGGGKVGWGVGGGLGGNGGVGVVGGGLKRYGRGVGGLGEVYRKEGRERV